VREPLQFTAPAGGPPLPAGSPSPASVIAPDAPVSGQMPVAASSFNPVGDMMAGAASALQPSSLGAEVSVPRIAIHVFAERQDTLAAAERAGQDRRLSRATTQIRVGGVPAAVEAYHHEPTPPLIIVECLSDPHTLLQQVDQPGRGLRRGHQGRRHRRHQRHHPVPRTDASRGVSEYLVAPLQPLQLIAAIGGLFADPAQPFVGRSIAFVGARGGAGASSVAHNTAYAMSERIGANTVIVDYDLPFGTAGLDFNQDPLNGVADALGQPDRLDRHPAGPDDGPLHGQAVAVRRARHPRRRLGHQHRTPSRR
jgi:pilus assembly protein CpaE